MRFMAVSSTVKGIVIAALFAAAGIGVYVATTQSEAAPVVAFSSIKGEQSSFTALKGKVVLVNFWATSCSGCMHEMPALIDIHNKYKAQGFETVSIAMSYDPPNYVLSYAESKQLPFLVTLDTQGKLAESFGGILGTPATFVIDRKGKIVRRYLGEPNFAELHELLEAKLAEKA